MNKRKFLDTLKEMKGKSYIYGNQTYKVIDYSIEDARQRVTIKTDKKQFDRNYDNIEEFLTYWQAVVETTTETQSESEPQSNEVSTEVFTEHNNLAKDLIAILKDNIEKVKKDKNYIPQAQAINVSVNNVINLTRLQLDMHKHFKSKKVS